MRVPVLLLNESFGDSGETEQYILHFSEWLTHLGYQITLAFGRKSSPDFSSPIILEMECPLLAGRAGEDTLADLRKFETQALFSDPALVIVHDTFHWKAIEALQRALPGVPRVWFAHDSFFSLLDSGVPGAGGGPATPMAIPGAASTGRPGSIGGECAFAEGVGHLDEFLGMARNFDRIVVAGDPRKSRIVKEISIAPERVRVLPGRSRQPASACGAVRPGGVLFTAAIAEENGAAELIASMARIRRVPRLRLTIAGQASDPAYLERCRLLAESLEAEREGLEIDFIPDPTLEEMEELYRQGPVVALPCLRPAPFPVEAQEAMERGLPIVTFDVGGMDTLVRKNETGLLARPGDIRDLAGKVEWMLVHGREAGRMGRAARTLAGWEFHSQGHVAALNRLFEGLVGPGKGTPSSGAMAFHA